MTTSNSYKWSPEVFLECYNAIKFEDHVPIQLIDSLQHDLKQILIIPCKSETSRNKLALGQGESDKMVKLQEGELKLNKPFIENSILFSNQLNLDELHSCELLSNASEISFNKGTDFLDSGRLAFCQRYDYILNILGYLITSNQLNLLTQDPNIIFKNVLSSFEKIYEILGLINNSIDKQKVTSNVNDLTFINSINYLKNQLWNNHELLGSILFGLFDNYFDKLNSVDCFNQLTSHISKHLSDDDILNVHYLPSLFKIIHNITHLSDNEVDGFYKNIINKLSTDYSKVKIDDEIDLSKSSLKSFEIVLYLTFFIKFISWCKELDQRLTEYDFKDDILKYVDWTVNYGVMEKILCTTADTASKSTSDLLELRNLYDFRSLLQKTFPRLTPLKFIYPDSQELINASKLKPGLENIPLLVSTSKYKISPSFSDSLIAPFFHDFFASFINNAAVVLTSLRNSEEDFLLSSINRKQLEAEENNKADDPFNEDSIDDYDNFTNNLEKLSSKSNSKSSNDSLDLDEISIRSDLERFYLAFVYTYSNRPELCSTFWEDEDISNEIIGFITWGLGNNTSPLITATFCLLIASLTSGGSDISAKIWEILVHNCSNSSKKKNDYSKISIDSIIDSLNYYVNSLIENFEIDLINQLKQNQKRQDFLFSSSLNGDTKQSNQERIIIELAEDSVVFISGFIQLISSIVKNLSNEDPRSKEIKNIAFARFSPIINSFLKFDNLITSSKNVQISQASNSLKIESPNIIIDETNRAVLINLLLTFLSDFVENDDNLSLRFKIWETIDRWFCQSLSESQNQDINTTSQGSGKLDFMSEDKSSSSSYFKLKYQNRKIKINQGLQINLSQLSNVGNFVNLLHNLLAPLKNDHIAFKTYQLLYPADLGYGYRINNQIGVWPYIEYLLLELFAKSTDLRDDLESKYYLQSTILRIIKNSFEEIDWKFLNDVAPKVLSNLNLNNLFDIDYQLFIKLHHSIAILNYLFDEKAYNALFGILSIGSESINESEDLANLVQDGLEIVDKILNVQDTFINRLLPSLKTQSTPSFGTATNMSLVLSSSKNIYDNIYFHKTLGTNGVVDFYEILLFNLSSIAHFANYVGNYNESIAHLSVKLLRNISKSTYFNAKINNVADPLLSKNRLVTIFETIDESVKIKYSFIEQMSFQGNLKIKYDILKLLNENLLDRNTDASISHFLLGYTIKGNQLLLEYDDENSLLKCILNLLIYSLDSISEIDYNNGYKHIIDEGPAKLISLILEVLINLCRNLNLSYTTLEYLRNGNFDLFNRLILSQPKIDSQTIWSQSSFNGDLNDENNEFLKDGLNQESFFLFMNHRILILQYLSLELHNVKSLTQKNDYIKLLLNGDEFLNGSPKIVNFLDILNYQFYNFDNFRLVEFAKKYDLELVLKEFENDERDERILSKIYRTLCSQANKSVNKLDFIESITQESSIIENGLNKFIHVSKLSSIQLRCLHSWVQVIQVLVNGDLINNKCDFILEILQHILPKINNYFGNESQIEFAEELISLCVLLFDVYEGENFNEKHGLYLTKLIPLFQTCINGILSLNASSTLRLDLYVLLNKFLQKSFGNEGLINKVNQILKLIDFKLIDTVCNDLINSEGSPRITSIILLESMVHLSSNYILEKIIKNNALLLLVRSVKRTDEMLKVCQENESGISSTTLLYELTAFKATLYLLIRIAQTRQGASQLIQNEIFPTLRNLKFVGIDPDLGLLIRLNNDPENTVVTLTLDIPINLADETDSQNQDISYYEFLVPVFQLVVAVVLSMGPQYKPSMVQVKEMMKQFDRLIVGVIKRDVLIEKKELSGEYYQNNLISLDGLKELIKLFTLLDSLIQ